MNEIQLRREQPGDALLSELIRAEEVGDKLTEVELMDQCNLMLVAGNVTTTGLIGNGVKALLDSPEQMTLLKKILGSLVMRWKKCFGSIVRSWSQPLVPTRIPKYKVALL